MRIAFSADGGRTWKILAAAAKNTGAFAWKVPNAVSNRCLIRVGDAIDGLPFDAGDREFSIVK